MSGWAACGALFRVCSSILEGAILLDDSSHAGAAERIPIEVLEVQASGMAINATLCAKRGLVDFMVAALTNCM